ncbi:MAG: PilW family protein [Myxococcota bacterium]
MKNRVSSAGGFSLIELMIALVVMGVVTSQLFVVFANQKKVFTSNDRALDVQETSRLTLDLVAFDTRMAGFMVPPYTAVASVDGGTDHADRLCVSAPSSGGAGPVVQNRIARFDGATVRTIVSGAPPSITVDTLDFDLDLTWDFVQNSGIIVASATKSYCARILTVTNVGGVNTITFAVPNTEDPAAFLGAVTADMRAVPANVYELDEGLLELRRNNLLLGTQVEDFQVEYWLDNAGLPNGVEDGDTEFPVNDLNNPDPPGGGIPAENDLVRRVRVSVMARTIRTDLNDSATGHLLGGRPALANRNAAAAADGFRRRSFSASILPRNIIQLQAPS